MSRLAWLYLWGILLIAGCLLAITYVGQPVASTDVLTLLVLTALATYGQFLEVKYGRDSYYPHTVPFFAALLLLPPLAFVVVVMIPHLIEWLQKRLKGNPYPWYIQPYNIATHIIAGLAAQWVFFHLGGTFTEFSLQSTLAAIIPTLLVYIFINHILIGQILVLARGLSWSDSGVLGFEALAIESVMMSIGYVAALLWTLTPWLLILVLAPFVFFQRVLKLPKLEKQSQTDGKTGLWNAQYFEQRLTEELAHALYFNQPLAVIMADLDLLRDINNAYGHLAGDAVIAGIGEIIMQTVRKEDVACRFGGEEYAILLPNVDQLTAAAIAERIRQTVESTPYQVVTSATPIHATMSLGLACFPRDGQSFTELIHEADVALYQAKIQGRNRVISTTDVPHVARLLFDEAQAKNRPAEALPKASPPLVTPQAETPAAPEPKIASFEHSPTTISAPMATNEPTPSLQRERSLPTRLRLFVGGIIAAGFFFTLFVFLSDPLVDIPPLIVFSVLAFGAQWLQTEMYEKSAVSISMAIILAAAVVSGPIGDLTTSTVVLVAHAVRTRPRIYKVLFNWSTHLLAGLGPLAAIHFSSYYLSNPLSSQFLLWWIVPVAVSTVFYFLTETGLIATAIALSEGMSISTTWREQFRWLGRHYLVMGVLGFFLAVAYIDMGILGVLVFALPILIMHLTQKEYVERTENSVRELRRMNQELSQANHEIVQAKHAIEQLNEELFLTLAKIIDARDPYASGHAVQVGKYAQAIAQEMGLGAQTVAEIYRAGLLHDIGKIGIPEKILHKPTRLTDAEYEAIKNHATLGADFLKTYRNLRHLAPFVHHHHEWWDGTGYPDRLQREAIPLEARILAVCDAVEAMASDRPYQTGQPINKILHELKCCAGTQFDPAVVDVFVQVVHQHRELVVNSALTVSKVYYPSITNY